MAHFVSVEAKAELNDIWHYIAEEGTPESATHLIASITERFLLLAKFPYIGRARDDLPSGYRSSVVDDYVIFYRIHQNNDVLILHVVHGARDIQQYLQ